MKFDPDDIGAVARLRQAMTWSERKLRAFRMNMVDSLRPYVGSHNGANGRAAKVPINMIELGVNIFQRQIASGIPQALCTPRYQELRPGAADLEIVTNQQVKEMDLCGSLNSCGIDAMFLWGIMKVGVATSGEPADEEGFLHDVGQVFADPVLPEDFFLDMMAKRWEQVAYVGNHFRVGLDWARDNPQYDKKVREALSAQTPMQYDGDRGGNSIRSEALSQGDGPTYDEYKERCELIEVWLPEEGLILTLAGGMDTKPLRTVKWKGPKRGPYHILGLGEVPGNLVPLPPVALWKDLHDIANRILNKVTRQAERQKTITGVPGTATDDGNRVLNANDGDMIKLELPGEIKEFTTGGANQQNLGLVIWARDLMSYMAGNLEVIGGLAPQTKTVGQDKLLNANASERVQDMQRKMLLFTKGIVTDIAWHVWHDPLVHIPFQKPIQGTGLSIPSVFTPERRKGEFFDYTFEVDPYSLQAMSPSERVQSLQNFIMQMMVPLMPLMQQNGISIDWEGFFKLFSKYMQLPELNALIKYQQGQSQPPDQAPPGSQQQPAGQGQQPTAPPQTTRNYVRQNVPVGTQQGKSQQLAQMLFSKNGGSGSQPSELANMVR